MNRKRRFSISGKMFLFVGLTVFLAAFIVALISYVINAKKIDDYFKGLASDTARNVSFMVDAEYLRELRTAVESDEYRELRNLAEKTDNEALIKTYLMDKGLWEGYSKIRRQLIQYVGSMSSIRYLYVIVWGDKDATHDMYLIDADNVPIYETGYYEVRETEFLGVDASKDIAPTISKGDWGWLCSAFSPVYADDGTLVCQIGCDVGMNNIIHERRTNLAQIIIATVIIMIIILSGEMVLIRMNITKPLMSITEGMKKFTPEEGMDYKRSGVINLDIRNNDEIGDIYREIHSMQLRILDYLNDITTIQKEKEEAYTDTLTHVGSKISFAKKVEELNKAIETGDAEFAVVMVDINFLKTINDKYGHAIGDEYIKGCCKIICNIYSHSPVYRVGGDEFVTILTGDDYFVRYNKLKEMCDFFRHTYEHEDQKPWEHYSAAAGMAEYSFGDADFDVILKRADQKMYSEKAKFKRSLGIDPDER